MLVLMPIEVALHAAMGHRRDDGRSALVGDRVEKRIGIVRLVCHNGAGDDVVDQRPGLGQVVYLSTAEFPARQIAQSFDKAVDLGAQPASRAPDGLLAVFFAAPAACWCALTMVESRKTSSKSASLASSAKTRCHTPRSDQRAKRLYTLFQGPKLLGKSRQGEPVRAIHNTASTNKRLSRAVTPTSVALPGNIDSIRSYWSSRSINRGMIPTPSMSWNHSLTLIVNRT